MSSALVLYPAYSTITCGQAARYRQLIPGLKLLLADDEPSASDEGIFSEVVELPPPEEIDEACRILRPWLAKRRPDGILMQSERGLLTGAILAAEFGLKGPSVQAAHLCSNKYQQRLVLARAGICVPKFSLAESASDVRRLAGDFGFPIILKCVISTMSRLVTLVRSNEEIDSAVAAVLEGIAESRDAARLADFAKTARVDLGCDPRRQFLVESFVDGDMVESDGLVIGDKPFNFGVTEQIQSEDPPFFIEGYLFPAECADAGTIERISDEITRAVGLTDSGFSTEMRVHGQDVCVIEVNGRLGWDEGFSSLFQVRTHQERVFQALQLALGIPPDLTRDEKRFAALAYQTCYYDGVVEELPMPEELAQLETDRLTLGLATHKGARFFAPPYPYVYPHVAWALATHPSSSHSAYWQAREAVDSLKVTIKPVSGLSGEPNKFV